MKALLLERAGQMSLCEVELPVATAHDVVVDVEIAGIGGSEYLGYQNPGIRKLPSIMGHGFAGVTRDGRRVAVNPLRSCKECEQCTVGLHQLCEFWHLIGVHSDGGFAEQVVVPADAIVELPKHVTWEQAAFIEPFANATNAWELSGATANDKIAVIGAGSLGLGVVANAHTTGCPTIAISDSSDQRLAAARQLGATVGELSRQGIFDVVFDTAGNAESREQALALTRKGGCCVLLGFAEPEMTFNASELIRYQKQILGSFVFSHRQFEQSIKFASRTNSNWVENLSFEGVEPMLRRYLDGDFSMIKTALRPSR